MEHKCSIWINNSFNRSYYSSNFVDDEATLDIGDALEQDLVIRANDTSGNVQTYTINFTITNNSYVQDTSGSSDISTQWVKKEDNLTNRNPSTTFKYNITHQDYTGGTLQNGGTFTGTAGAYSIYTLYSNWTGDWLTEDYKTCLRRFPGGCERPLCQWGSGEAVYGQYQPRAF